MIRNVNIDSVKPSVATWTNWAMNQAATAGRFSPTSLADIVAAVRYAEREKGKIKAVGSSWSYTEVARPEDYWVSLDHLNEVLPTNMPALVRKGLNADRFVHVEAGIKLYQLNEQLWPQGKAMCTLGGSQGQSLAGAISTGTHGGDFDRAPLADAVRAIHLVGPGGQEYWLEPETDPLTEGNTLPIPDWFDGIQIIRSDSVFNAVLVSMGRCGIVYSYVIQVEPAYDLEEERHNALWQGQVGGALEVMRHTLLEAIPRGFENAWVNQRSPLGSSQPLRYLQIDIDPNSLNSAYVTRRWATEISSRVDNPPSKPSFHEYNAHVIGILLTNLGPIPPLEYLALVVSTFGGQRAPHVVRDRSYYVMAGRPEPYTSYTDQMDAMWRHQWRMLSVEFFFKATTPHYLDFIDALLETWHTSPGRKIGYISVRFMGKSRATLATQRWPVTVSIECAFFKGFPGADVGLHNVLLLGERYGALFHWGQQTPVGYGNRIPEIYGAALGEWSRAIAAVGVTPNDTFSSDYSLFHHLEPTLMPLHYASNDSLLLLLNPA